jgi:hypothetical protein
MAQNPALTQLYAQLNAAPHPGMGNDFFAHVGSHLALARTVPPAWFPKTGTATEAQIGGLIANLHSLESVTRRLVLSWVGRERALYRWLRRRLQSS